MNSTEIPILIPSFEPDQRLNILCKELVAEGLSDIILIDDGNGEKYRSIFDELQNKYQCTILRHAVNLGKGRALKYAFNYVLTERVNVIGCITADSDGQHSPNDIKKCMDKLRESPERLIFGCRDFSGTDVPFKSKFGNKLTKIVCKYLCNTNISDTQTGLRGVPREFMKQCLTIPGERFEFETNMLLKCKDSVQIEEVFIKTIYDSKKEHQTHFDPIWDSLRIYSIFGKMFIKYIFSSCSSCIIDLIAFALLCPLFKIWHGVLYVTAATIAARILSASYNFTINYKVVFKGNESPGTAASKYFLIACIQMGVSALLVTGCVVLFPIIPEVTIKAVIDTILFFASYYIQMKYVFYKPSYKK